MVTQIACTQGALRRVWAGAAAGALGAGRYHQGRGGHLPTSLLGRGLVTRSPSRWDTASVDRGGQETWVLRCRAPGEQGSEATGLSPTHSPFPGSPLLQLWGLLRAKKTEW